MITNKKIVITGGGGFIGTTLAERLVKDNQIVILDTNLERNSFAFSELKDNKNIVTAKVDILDMEQMSRFTQDAQIVVHMAAVLGVQEVIHRTSYTLDVNYMGTSNLLKALLNNPHCERIVVFSTSEIFGANAFHVAENSDSLLSSAQDVRWCYCLSKLAAEHLTFSYFREKGLPAVVVRPFNVFGPKRVGDHVVLRFILKALRNEDLEVYGDGTQIRAWCYIDDFCDALLQCLEVKQVNGQAFNIGNPRNTFTIYSLAKIIVSLCNSKSKIVFKALDFKDIDLRVPDTSKARDLLGFAPKIELEEGLSRTIGWVEKHADVLSKWTSIRERRYIP